MGKEIERKGRRKQNKEKSKLTFALERPAVSPREAGTHAQQSLSINWTLIAS